MGVRTGGDGDMTAEELITEVAVKLKRDKK